MLNTSLLDQSFLANFVAHAQRNPTTVFCEFLLKGKITSYTYGELLSNSLRYRDILKARGIEKGSIVIIILQHSPDLYFSFLGALLAQAIPSFLPFQTPKQDATIYWKSQIELFKRIRAQALITYQENLDLLQLYIDDLKNLEIISSNDFNSEEKIAEFDESTLLSGNEIAFLQHSSGTTGLKKGVTLSYDAITKQLLSYTKKLNLSEQDKIATWLPLYHDMGLITSFILPISRGIKIVSLDPFEWVIRPGILFEAIEKFKCSLCWLPNFAFHHLCRMIDSKKQYDLSSIRALINCSEPCRAETFAAFFDRFKQDKLDQKSLQVCYAMAEAVYAVTNTDLGTTPRILEIDVEDCASNLHISSRKEGRKYQKCISTGKAIFGISVKIKDIEGNFLPEKEAGEIVLQGEFLFSGYFRDPETTALKIKNGWYHTGDLGFIDQDELFVLGRIDDVLISHGKKFSALDLEQIVNSVAGVKPGRAIALSLHREEIGSNEIVIVVEKNEGSEEPQEKIITDIKKAVFNELGISIWEARVEKAGWIIKTTSGKLCRKENLGKIQNQRNLQ